MNALRGLPGIYARFSKSRALWLIPALLCAFAGCPKAPSGNSSPPASNYKKSVSAVARTEAGWIVQSVAGEIARLAAYAAKLGPGAIPPDFVTVNTLPSDAAGCHYAVEVHLPKKDAIRASIDITGAIWDPQAYVPLAREIFSRLQLDKQKQPAAIGGDPLASLVTPRVEVIQRENKRISQWLTEHPLDAAAHEQAALVIGALGMRENSGSFFDPRGLCNRATAHLALARAVRSGQAQSDCGAVGELLLGLFINAEKDSEKRIDALVSRAGAAPELKPWIMAARLRNRRDYRIMRDPARGTLLERIEFFRAMSEAAGTQAACKVLRSSLQEPLADWNRIALQFSLTPELGRRFTENAGPLEIAEAGKIFPDLLQSQPPPESFAKALNREPGHIVRYNAGGAPTVEVIDEGAWAMFFQRHLFHALSRTYSFLGNAWGDTDAAEELKASASAAYQKLTLFPLVSVDTSDAAWIQSESPAIQELIEGHPEWVPDGLWARAPQTRGSLQGGGVLLMRDWFAPGLPPGTAYGFWTRVLSLRDVRSMTKAEAERCSEVAPWHYGVAHKLLMTRADGHPSAARFKEALGRYLEFYQPAMLDYAAMVKKDPVEYVSILRRIAKDDPGYFLELGNYFAAHDREKEAVEAFERAISSQVDAVQFSNQCEWLVTYYATHDNNDRALEIARYAADTGSLGGLEAMARLMERLNRLDEAEESFLQIVERYGDRFQLAAFYYRQRLKDPDSKFARKYELMEEEAFPNGPRSVLVSDFTGPPDHGVRITASNEVVENAGLKPSDIIVAIDEKRVNDFDQYAFIRGLTESDEMDFIIYRDGKYRPVHATVPGRRFGAPMESYGP